MLLYYLCLCSSTLESELSIMHLYAQSESMQWKTRQGKWYRLLTSTWYTLNNRSESIGKAFWRLPKRGGKMRAHSQASTYTCISMYGGIGSTHTHTVLLWLSLHWFGSTYIGLTSQVAMNAAVGHGFFLWSEWFFCLLSPVGGKRITRWGLKNGKWYTMW